MLSTENADLIKRDPKIPGLALLLDPDAFINAIRPFIVEKSLATLAITYIRYKPATNCMAAYRLNIGGKILSIYAKAYGADADVKFKKASEKKNVPGPLGEGTISLKDIGIIVSVFPNDSKLKTLRRLGETEKLTDLLHGLFPDQPDFWDGTLHTLSYKPERRYVARLEVKGKSQAVLKFYTPQAFQTAHTNVSIFKSKKYLNIPKYMGSLDSRWVLVFNWLKGHLLSEIITADNNDLAIKMVRHTGNALAELHSQRVTGLTCRSRDSEMSVLFAVSDKLEFLCPSLAEQSKNIARDLAGWISAQPIIKKPIHGDFYAKQVLVDNGQINVVDFDEVVFGDPRADIGLFIAHMEIDVVRKLLPSNRIEPLTDALLNGYENGTWKAIPPDINAYTAVGLFQLAHQPFRRFYPDWGTKTKAILNTVEKYINKSSIGKPNNSKTRTVNQKTKQRNLIVIDTFGAAKDPKLPFLSRSLNPQVAERCLSEMLFPITDEECNLHLRSIKVVRYKPGRRCMVEYEVELRDSHNKNQIITLLGKTRAKGVDTATYDLCCSLWNAGFHAESPDGISIPQPIGIIPEMQMWFQRKVTGNLAINLLVGNRGLELSRRIAEAANKLHKANLPSQRRHTMTDELRILHDRLQYVTRLNPHWTERLKRLLDNCDHLGTAVQAYMTTGIHRDFYADQVLVDGDRLYLLDLDLYCEGEPGLDIGNFIGHITEYSLRKKGDEKALIDCEKALVDRFLQLAGNHFQTSIQTYATLTLVRHIYISTQFPDRRPYTESLLELCERRLGVQQNVSKQTVF